MADDNAGPVDAGGVVVGQKSRDLVGDILAAGAVKTTRSPLRTGWELKAEPGGPSGEAGHPFLDAENVVGGSTEEKDQMFVKDHGRCRWERYRGNTYSEIQIML